ncbi:hypothetical protein PENDEC_c019G03450 [Penicillium decumbens]|uniref:Uncharacterized protein n=1 Tax=Penicillium decumbens TaxID=69771 RepID=A0A1V6P704_PENDC|nr:hypothetical protein PENDEC_c019G03450 [Penicillium decumbens]
MRLLHHFTSCTSTTLSDGAEAYQTWATTVVQIAFAQNFLQGIYENKINSRALEILVEAFNSVSEDSKANTSQSVDKLLSDALPTEDEISPRDKCSNYLSLSFGWLFEFPLVL